MNTGLRVIAAAFRRAGVDGSVVVEDTLPSPIPLGPSGFARGLLRHGGSLMADVLTQAEEACELAGRFAAGDLVVGIAAIQLAAQLCSWRGYGMAAKPKPPAKRPAPASTRKPPPSNINIAEASDALRRDEVRGRNKASYLRITAGVLNYYEAEPFDGTVLTAGDGKRAGGSS